ncbi:hypothetical protein GCM10022243_62800 [Saccharothrix violaceirubra]|uniref:Uncharacterized protein n=1 Tax=Saccharothrix violaceirubra TaxID=413306 RepID=A0A7W7SXG7_9PSEU|nr:hypothetical protein [Saccharothrix violaceirubra]MBB4962773.1 hypothetical protein [Saccharothrix violaceirubra]
MTPPRVLEISRLLWVASALVGMLRFVVQLADRDMLIDELLRQNPGLGQDEIDLTVNGSIVVGLLFGGLLVLVYALLSRRMLSGRNWARVVLTVFGAIGVFVGLGRSLLVVSGAAAAAGVAVTAVDVVAGLVTAALDGTAAVLMYRSASSAYFAAVTRARAVGGVV